MNLKSILIVISTCVFLSANAVVSGQVYYKVIIDSSGGSDGKIMISQNRDWIKSNDVCPPPPLDIYCAIIEINGSDGRKLPEYLLACLNKMDQFIGGFRRTGSHYKFTFTGEHHCLQELEFYYDATSGTNIRILTRVGVNPGKEGTIRLSQTALRQEQIKVDYMVSLLLEAITNANSASGLQTWICFTTDVDGVITKMYAGRGDGSLSCEP